MGSLSPIIASLEHEFTISPITLGLVGTAPPLCFALLGLLTPYLARTLGLERSTMLALAIIASGLFARALVGSEIALLITTVVVFSGVGVGNILLPPLVKKFFPDRIGEMVALYSMTMSVAALTPPLVTAPAAETMGWRAALAVWGIPTALGVIVWMVLVPRGDRPAEISVTASGLGHAAHRLRQCEANRFSGTPRAKPVRFGRMLRLDLVWSLTLLSGASSAIAYVTFMWIPPLLSDIGHVRAAEAGALLALFAFVGLPSGLVIPVLVTRFRAVRVPCLIGVSGGLAGLLGLIVAPDPQLLWIWMVLLGLTVLLFALSLSLITSRSRTAEGAVALSSVVQSMGYGLAGLFPVLFGLLHTVTGSWTAPLLLLVASLLMVTPAGVIAGRETTFEDEWERKNGPW